MTDEKFIIRKVENARFNMIKYLNENWTLEIPVTLRIPYSRKEYERIKRLFPKIKEYAYKRRLHVEIVEPEANDKYVDLRYEYIFEEQ